MISETSPLSSAAQWDKDLIAKYDIAGPRYTSYPTAPQFDAAFTAADYRRLLDADWKGGIAPLSLYIHIPFCRNICYYCACNKVVTRDAAAGRRYLDYLEKEIRLQGELIGKRRKVMQLHFGGGTPTFLDGAELTELMHVLAMNFRLSDDAHREYSIEVDPRSVSSDSLALLKGLGFNRLSFGVQDFDPQVQRAINRIQSVEMVSELTATARLHQYNSVSFDLIYGLPFQTLDSLRKTLAQVVDLAPDRIAFYNYAHLPERFKSQRSIDRHDLPTAEQKIDMLMLIADTLQRAGYLHIGMDHFVKPSDDLAHAQREGKLQRNFQGYSTCKAPDLVGLGVSAISSVKNSYSQNERELDAYYQRLDRGELPICRGLLLDTDDLIRRQVISQLICHLGVCTEAIEDQFDIVFSEYFQGELVALKDFEADGLVSWEGSSLRVTARGRTVLRNICMCFDKYMHADNGHRFSSAI